MARNSKIDLSEELGCQLSPSERIIRVMQEVDGVKASYNITDWEWNWLKDNSDSTYPNFTPRMEAVMQKIEAKVFGESLQEIAGLNNDELTGELRFKKR